VTHSSSEASSEATRKHNGTDSGEGGRTTGRDRRKVGEREIDGVTKVRTTLVVVANAVCKPLTDGSPHI